MSFRVRPRLTAVVRAAAAALLLTAAVAACTGDEADEAPSPAEDAQSPAATEPTRLSLGEPASLTVESGARRSSKVELTVLNVDKGARKDLRDFVLSGQPKRATPYYATVRVKNIGTGDLSRSHITLWALDSSNTVRPPAKIMGTFGRCDHALMPKAFTKGETARTCLTYLVPKGVKLDAVQYRFEGERPPYSWPVG